VNGYAKRKGKELDIMLSEVEKRKNHRFMVYRGRGRSKRRGMLREGGVAFESEKELRPEKDLIAKLLEDVKGKCESKGIADMKKRLLVVDNDPVILSFMSRLLKKEGYQVETAEDGLSAVKILKTYTPDVLFIDLVMPNISGKKLCRIIRRIPKMKSAKIIVISAIAAEEKVDFIEFGADACIAKGPFNKMSEHVLGVLDQLGKGTPHSLPKKVVGLGYVDEHNIIKELLSSKRHFEAILENMSEGILELNHKGKIIYANPNAVLLIGIPEEGLLASNFSEHFNDPHRRKVLKLMDSFDSGPKKITADSPTILNGKEVSLNIIPIEEDEYKSIIIILNDVTERRQMEAQLLRARKMEVMGTLAGGVAHDLNNVLSSVIGYPELILMDLPEDSPVRTRIQTIQKSGQRAAAIVRDLLTLARGGVANTEAVNLNHIISDYVKSPEHEKLISFHPDVQMETYPEDDLLNILGSPIHLTKTIMNLVSNAAEATPCGGKILISTKTRYIDRPIRGYEVVGEGSYVVLTISDTGIGIPAEDMERIFEPFYTKKVMGRSGTGLGMAVVWGTVKDHKGFIDVKSIEGKGTTFKLYFPVTREELTKDKSKLSIEEYIGSGESILIVDDIEEQREIVTEMLRKLGYTVTVVSSGKEAVDYMKENSADLLILDMIMDPGIDGLETFEKILKLHPGQRAVITSGFFETERVKKAQELGAGLYIRKPFILEKIGLAVKAELGR